MKNTGKECAMLYREFCEWCYTVPDLELDPRLHTHSGRIEDGGYISNGVTAKAFAAWKAARCAPAAPQPQADARDADRYRWLRSQPLESDVFCITIWRKGSDGFGDDLRLEKLDDAIDAAIAAAKGAQK